jgi:hypothetical protein
MPNGVICGGAVEGSNHEGAIVTCQAITTSPAAGWPAAPEAGPSIARAIMHSAAHPPRARRPTTRAGDHAHLQAKRRWLVRFRENLPRPGGRVNRAGRARRADGRRRPARLVAPSALSWRGTQIDQVSDHTPEGDMHCDRISADCHLDLCWPLRRKIVCENAGKLCGLTPG